MTELAVIEVTPKGLLLREVAPGVTPDAVQKATEPLLLRAPDLRIISRSQYIMMEPHSIVVLSLHTPKERLWGELLDVSNRGSHATRHRPWRLSTTLSAKCCIRKATASGCLHFFSRCFGSSGSRSTSLVAPFLLSRRCLKKKLVARWRSISRSSLDRTAIR